VDTLIAAMNGHSPTRRFIKYRQRQRTRGSHEHAWNRHTPYTSTSTSTGSTTNTFFKSKLGWILGSGFKTSNSPRRHHRVQLNHRHHQLHVPHRGRIHVGFHKHIHKPAVGFFEQKILAKITITKQLRFRRRHSRVRPVGNAPHRHTHISVKRIYNGYPYNSSATLECHRSQRSGLLFHSK
jgi:hypothetical protein